jgi:beta-galactosidase
MMAFTHFLTERTNQHARDRYDVMKGVDPQHPVTVHGAFPAPTWPGTPDNQVLNRGNDWDFADHLDGVGCSSFPKWQKLDDADFGMRIEFVKSAARGKHVWLSELQGGRSSTAFEIFPAVDALSQQRWIWNGIACGADTILFWCWRDEVFGRESAGFGLIGADGLAEERLEAMKVTGTAIERHSELLSAYEPVTPEVGVLFSPQSYYLNWAAEGHANRCVLSLMGYARALVRRSIPYVIVEECHLDQLEGLKVLFMPKTIALSEDTERRLQAWVEAGGVLVTESECGAFGPEGLYRYSPDRWLAKMTGVTEIGRRPCEGEFLPVSVAGEELELPITQWVTPMDGSGKALASSAQGPLVLRRDVGQGSVVLCGAYFGEAYRAKYAPGFERFLEAMAREAGWTPQYEVLAPAAEDDRFLYVKMGASQGRTVAFVFFPEGWPEGRVRFAPGAFPNGQAADIITGAEVAFEEGPGGQEATLTAPDWRFYVLAGA